MKSKIIFLQKVVILSWIFLVSSYDKIEAQIMYTDIPDATPNATYPLDLNNDGIVDFVIQAFSSSTGIGQMCTPQNNNAYAGEFAGGTYLPWALPEYNSICPSLMTWYGATNPGTMSVGTNVGNWVGQTDKYLALKIIVGTDAYYGWARLDVAETSSSFTIKDYAYESTTNTCIQAKQETLLIPEIRTNSGFQIFPNPFHFSTTIQTTGNFKHATITISNLLGQTVKQINTISTQAIILSRENLPSGVYWVQFTEDNKHLLTQKLVIIDE